MTTTTTQRNRAAIYRRVSDPKQEDGASLDAQLDRCRALAERSGYEVVADEFDLHTGFDLAERPGLMSIRKLMRQRLIDVLLVHKLDRLSRNQQHQAVILYDAECASVLLHSVEEGPQDQTTALGKFLTSVRGFVAEQERENIRFRSEMGRRGRAEKGRPLVGCRPLYGYLWVTDLDGRKLTLAPDPETAPIVRRIYADVAAGVTLARLARALTQEGVPTPTQLLARRGTLPKKMTPANIWSIGTLHYLISNPAYMGMHVAFRWRQSYRYDSDELTGQVRRVTHTRLRAGDDSSRVALPSESCPALVDADTWDLAQRRMASNRSNATRNTRAPQEVLLRGGIARCGYCWRKLSHKPHNGKRGYFCVNRKSRAELARHECEAGYSILDVETLDREVWEWMTAKLDDPDLLADLIALWEDEKGEDRAEAEKEIKSREGALADLKNTRNNIAAGMGDANDPDTRAVLLAQIDNLNPQIRNAEAEIAARRDALQDFTLDAAQIDALRPWLDSLAAQKQDADYEGKRRILRALGVRIRCYRTDHVNPTNGKPERWHPYWFEDIDALAAIDSRSACRTRA